MLVKMPIKIINYTDAFLCISRKTVNINVYDEGRTDFIYIYW